MFELLQRPHRSERLSIPVAGRTLLSSTRCWAEPILNAHQQLQSFLHREISTDVLSNTYETHYSFLRFDEAHRLAPSVLVSINSAALILNWLAGNSIGSLSSKSSLSEAEHWCLNPEVNATLLSDKLPPQVQSSILTPLFNLDYDRKFLDILPYAAEVFETSEEILKAYGSSRKSKRAAGVFYTPSDVSDYLIAHLATNSTPDDVGERVWLDPACGTGCFLLSALYRIAQEKELPPGEETLNYAAKCLYGIDISPIALQSAAYIMVLTSKQHGLKEAGSLKRGLSLFGKNLLVADATQVKRREDLALISPSLKSGVDFVVSNPPYVKRKINRAGQQSALFQQVKKEEKGSESIYLHFVRMMPLLSRKVSGGGGMVVPLSIAYNTRQEFQRIRQLMWSNGEWRTAHFDRTPDSLFGDDVKTRNSIIFFSQEGSGGKRVYTSELIRWSSRSRAGLFNDIQFSTVAKSFRNNIIPKIGNEVGQELLTQIYQKSKATLSNSINRVTSWLKRPEGLFRNGNTAYNWLPFELVMDDPDSDSFSRYRYWATQHPEDTTLIFCLLQSRVAYWLWRVWGDGFHLTDQFILSLPLSPLNLSQDARGKLRTLGENLWASMQENKVTSKNAGIESTSYCPYLCVDILDDIDRVIAVEYTLPPESIKYLKDFIQRTIVAGREDEIKVNPSLRKWLNKDGQYATHFAGN